MNHSPERSSSQDSKGGMSKEIGKEATKAKTHAATHKVPSDGSNLWEHVKRIPYRPIQLIFWISGLLQQAWTFAKRGRAHYPATFGFILATILTFVFFVSFALILVQKSPLLTQFSVKLIAGSLNWEVPTGTIGIASVDEDDTPPSLRAYVVLHGGGGKLWVFEHTCTGYGNFRWEISTKMPYTVSVDGLMIATADYNYQILPRLEVPSTSVQAFNVPYCREGAKLFAVTHFSPIKEPIRDFDSNPIPHVRSVALP